MEMIKHPIKKRLEELANGDVVRIVPFVYKYICHESHALEILNFAQGFVDSIQLMCDVYERKPFEIQHGENGMSYIYGRYAFSDITVVDKPKRISIDRVFHEIAYGGKAIKLEGTYTLLELESIVNKLKDEENNE
jgi:hypothetical protein